MRACGGPGPASPPVGRGRGLRGARRAVGRTGACDWQSPGLRCIPIGIRRVGRPVRVRSDDRPIRVRSNDRPNDRHRSDGAFERCFSTNSARGRHSESRSADSCGRGLGPDARCPGLQQFMIAKDELGARVLRRSPLRRTPVAPSAQWQDHARRSQVKHPEKQTTMKHALIAVLATLTVALPAEASEKPSRADMLKGLIVVRSLFQNLPSSPKRSRQGRDPGHIENVRRAGFGLAGMVYG